MVSCDVPSPSVFAWKNKREDRFTDVTVLTALVAGLVFVYFPVRVSVGPGYVSMLPGGASNG